MHHQMQRRAIAELRQIAARIRPVVTATRSIMLGIFDEELNAAERALDAGDDTRAFGAICFASGIIYDQSLVKREDLWWLDVTSKLPACVAPVRHHAIS